MDILSFAAPSAGREPAYRQKHVIEFPGLDLELVAVEWRRGEGADTGQGPVFANLKDPGLCFTVALVNRATGETYYPSRAGYDGDSDLGSPCAAPATRRT